MSPAICPPEPPDAAAALKQPADTHRGLTGIWNQRAAWSRCINFLQTLHFLRQEL